jgi:hypothetical protein
MIHDSFPANHPFHGIEASVKESWCDKLLTDNYYTPNICIDIIKLVRETLSKEGFISPTEPDLNSYIIRNVRMINIHFVLFSINAYSI